MNTSDYPAKESGRREPLNEAFTPDMITELGPDDVFVFGSNLAGQHCGGAARTAFQRFGAVWGEGEGLQGQSYAIPTMHGGVAAIRPYVDRFIEFHPPPPQRPPAKRFRRHPPEQPTCIVRLPQFWP